MITFGITVADEFFEFKRLIQSLQPYLLKDEEIIVLADSNKITKEIIEFCESCKLKINYFNFQKDFSEFKNTLFSLSNKDYLFQIDADEQIPLSLITSLRELVANNKTIDLVWIPRINFIYGATDQDILNFKWIINENGWEGFPDYQARFVSTKKQITWKNKVHEILTGAENPVQLNPNKLYSILHVKDIKKQRKQNIFYDSI
jgi:glycosyltransferase involved in cell wall biosynthesis